LLLLSSILEGPFYRLALGGGGKRKINFVPLPISLSNDIDPPSPSVRRLTTANPKPCPLNLVVNNGVNSLALIQVMPPCTDCLHFLLVRKFKGYPATYNIMSEFFRSFLVAILISALFSASLALPAQGQTTNNYLLDIRGSTWDHAVLNALIVTPDNESWWNPLFLNSTIRAIGQWNDAISDFALNYSDYSYLSSVKIQPVISNVSQSNFDIYINWAQFPLSNSSEIIGLAQTFENSRKTVVNSTINLATHTSHGDAINEGDAQNIALHELGHSLGLGHSNYTGDLMYPMYALRGGEQLVSTRYVWGSDCFWLAAKSRRVFSCEQLAETKLCYFAFDNYTSVFGCVSRECPSTDNRE